MQTVDVIRVKSWVAADEAILVDVREPAEFASEHIPGALSLPLSGLSAAQLPELGGKRLLIYCRSGRRGGMACDKLGDGAYNLEGGIEAWMAAGLPVERGARRMLPLDRQVQLTIGSAVLLGTLLGYFVHPAFLILSGFFGAGLMMAGLTGFCGLALLMAKAPWNRGNPVSCGLKT